MDLLENPFDVCVWSHKTNLKLNPPPHPPTYTHTHRWDNHLWRQPVEGLVSPLSHRLWDITVIKQECTLMLGSNWLSPSLVSQYYDAEFFLQRCLVTFLNELWTQFDSRSCVCKLGNCFSLVVKEMDGQHSAWVQSGSHPCTVNKSRCGWGGE